MTGPARKWDDLRTRISTALILLMIGGAATWQGGIWFLGLCAVVVVLMIWELARMLSPEQTTAGYVLALSAGLAVFGYFLTVPPISWAILIGPAVLGGIWLRKDKQIFALYGLAIVGAGVGMVLVRSDLGMIWVVWLIGVVIITDVAGYFAGRMLGGPKFWPRISPKKTWSGTIAGWIGAALVGAVFIGATGATSSLIFFSALVALASQMGDISESAIKRHCGIKDSSNLLPGHGGLLDRFDGMIGATVLVLLTVVIFGFETVAG